MPVAGDPEWGGGNKSCLPDKSGDPVPQSISALISCGNGFATNLARRTAAIVKKYLNNLIFIIRNVCIIQRIRS